jgi:hypothetical protein
MNDTFLEQQINIKFYVQLSLQMTKFVVETTDISMTEES